MAQPAAKLTLGEDYEAEFMQAAYLSKHDAPTQEELEATLPAVAPFDDEEANKSLRAVRYWRDERDTIQAQAKAEIERIQVWADAEISRIDRRISWHERGLVEYLKASGKKTLKMAYGTLKRIAGRDRIEVADELRFFAWANQDPSRQKFIRIKQEPIKKAIMDHIKATGEIPEFCELVTGEDTFKVDTE